jgi:fatty-acid desaturase
MASTHFSDRRPWMRPWWHYSKGNGPVLFYIVSIHVLALAGLILFPAPRWPVLLAGFGVLSIGGIGTTVCSHRCLAHRSLRLNPVIETS